MDSSDSVEKRLRKLVDMFEHGDLTSRELDWKIWDCVLEPSFFKYLDLLPERSIEALRERANEASAHPEDILIILAGSYLREPTEEEYFASDKAARESCFRIDKRLREHFFPGRPLPAFEAVKLAGVVEESVEIDGSVVVFGEEISSYLIRRNPIQLITPSGRKVITSVQKQRWIKSESDAKSHDPITRQAGRLGLFLAENVKSAAEIPPKTALWVDRTAVAALPD